MKTSKKYCITCLEKGYICECNIDCFNLEHQKKYEGKTDTTEHFNNLLDEKINELLSIRDLLIDTYKMIKK